MKGSETEIRRSLVGFGNGRRLYVCGTLLAKRGVRRGCRLALAWRIVVIQLRCIADEIRLLTRDYHSRRNLRARASMDSL